MTQNEYLYAICCQLEVADDAVSGRNEETFQIAVNLWVASFSSFEEIEIRHLFNAYTE